MKLLKHFKELTIRPKNAKELKGLILQLAIQGKLTANWRKENPDIEATSELLKRIQKEKKKLAKDKEIKNEKLELINDSTVFPFEIPSSWELLRLGDTMSIIRGVSFKKHEVSEIQSTDTIGVLRGQNMVNSVINKNKLIYISRNKVKDSQIVSKGDIAITLSSGSDKLVGKIGLSSFDEEFTIGAFYGKLKVFIEETKYYILNYLDSPLYKNQLKGAFRGIGINNLSNAKVKNLIIPLPPLKEQKEIVKVVATLFKEVEQLEQLTVARIGLKEDFVTSALNQLTTNNANQEWTYLQNHFKSFFNETTNIKKLRETVLQLAVQGKLTADWRANNPDTKDANELLKRIQEEKAQLIKDKKIKKEKALPPITKEEIPYELAEGWVWCRFGDLITFLNGYAFKSSTYVPLSEYQIIRLGNVKSDNFLINTKEAYVPESIGKETLAYKLYKDDILTTLTGTKDKRDYCYTCLVKYEHLEDKTLLLNQRVGCIRAIDKSSSELLNKFLKSEIILNQLFETETGTANQGNIGSTSFKNLVFPLPPLEEQKAIVEKVNALMGLCDVLEQEVLQSQKHSEMMMQSVLREVFEPNNLN